MAKAAPKRLTGRDWAILGIVSTVFTVIWITLFVPYVLMPYVLDRTFRTFDFKQNEWFDAPDVKIVDGFGRSDLAVANDELFYEINYKNKQSYGITLSPQLQIMHGGEVLHTIDNIEPVTISGDGTGQHRIRFFTDNTGMNQLILGVRVTNSTDSTLFGTVQETFNIPVYSQEAAEQYGQNEMSFWGIFISGAIGFFTLLALYANVTLSRRQTEQLRRQNELTVQRIEREEQRHDSESREKREKVIGEHTGRIIEEIKNAYSRREGRDVVGIDWITGIEFSRHSKKKLIQHLYTDRMDLFNLFSEAVSARGALQTMKKELPKKLESQVQAAIESVGKSQSSDHEKKNFAAEAADYLMVYVGSKEFKKFEPQFKESMSKQYYVTQPGFAYSVVYSEKELAESLATRLDSIAAEQQTVEECSKYQEIARGAERLTLSCENKFESMLSAVRTHGAQMQGACEDCIKEYDEPDVSKLTAAFSELEKTSLYSHLAGKED